MSVITSIATANPPNRISQPAIAAFMSKAMLLRNGDARKLNMIFRSSGIDYRYSVLADYGRTEAFGFFPDDNNRTFPTTKDRLAVFRETALPLSVDASNKALSQAGLTAQDVSHIIVVCCTGMYAPGLDIELVNAMKLRKGVHRTAINFMGCYAAFNALKIADAFCAANQRSKVLVVCTELCSLHFQREATEDNLLANALFGDGCAAVVVEANSRSRLQLELCAFHNDLSDDEGKNMAWSIGDLGFEMKLSAYVPEMISSGIRTVTNSLLHSISRKLTDIAHFAIHPGGKRILEVIEKELGIAKEKNAAAYHVLKNFGNMSSATVLFVLEELIRNLDGTNTGDEVLSFAFGPGLTLESMVLRINKI